MSAAIQTAVVNRYSRQSWAMLATLARCRQPALLELSDTLMGTDPPVTKIGLSPTEIAHDPDMAIQFTNMLYEFHRGFAHCIAESIELSNVTKVVDLGGGPGVVSMALCRRNPIDEGREERMRHSIIDHPIYYSNSRAVACAGS